MRRIALCFAFLSALACSSDKKNDDDQDQDEGTEVGPSGGQVVADDGALTLDIPAGALADNVRISVIAHGAEGRGVAFEGIPSIATYEFAPEGLTFAAPVVVTAVLPGVTVVSGENARVPLVIATLDGSGVIDINKRQETKVDLDAGSTTHTTEISHFSGIGYHNFIDAVELTFEPVPPPEMVMGIQYGVGVRLKSLTSWPVAFDLIYDDNSTGVIGFGGGSVPILLAQVSGNGFDQLVPATFYACLQPGTPTYSARVSTRGADGGVALSLVNTLSIGEHSGSSPSGNARDLAPSWPLTGPEVDVSIEVTRQIDCQPADGPDPVMGPPYSGLVQYQGWNFENGNWPTVTAAFSAGGADQAAFDAYVNMVQSFYGIQAIRGGAGSCQPLQTFDIDDGEGGTLHSFLNDALIPAAKHVGAGANDKVVAKFPAELEASFDTTYNIYRGNPVPALTVTADGIAIHAPADVATPIITLPGLASDAGTVGFQPDSSDIPESGGVTVSWQSDEVDAEFMHVVVWGQGNLGLAGYECFVEVGTQVFTVPQNVLDAIYNDIWDGSPSAAYFVDVNVMMAKRREVAYQGGTLLGFFVRVASGTYYYCGEGSC